MDAYDLAEDRGSAAEALAEFDGEALVVSFTGDWHFTVEQAEHLTAAFREGGTAVRHRVVESDHGHDAFLVETEQVGPLLAEFLADGTASERRCVAGDSQGDRHDQSP
ncbi:hypothetical protein [Halovenus salina]|uniref:Homoserine O-acetyltransferase n=2 Tax=Halovenus salina TaxID=1510225 RepID=A0ABD5W8S4_9EURY